jgi:flagellar biosynthetic protein FliR
VNKVDLLFSNPYEYLDAFLLIFVRTIGLFIMVPLFSNSSIPNISKIGLAFFISAIVINTIDYSVAVSSTDFLNYGLVLAKEFFVGWLIGFSAYLAYSILMLVGQFVDYQIGFSMVNVFDPLSQIQLTITGNLYYYLALLLAIITNAHHIFIRGLIASFELIPIGSMVLSQSLNESVIGFMDQYFLVALQIASPFFAVMLITNIVLGILARTAPQMNLFVIGFPLKIILGLFVLLITLNLFSNVTDIIIDNSIHFIDQTIKGMIP